MRTMFLSLILLSACAHGYVTLGYDAAKTTQGGGTSAAVPATASTGSVGFGVGGRTTGLELHLQSLDVDPMPGGDRFVAGSSALELRFVALAMGPFVLYAHGGPLLGVVYDKEMGDVTEGVGLRGGAGAEVRWKGVALWLDAARDQLTFGGQVVNGRGDRDVIAVGVRLGGS